jgi:hypothetical protein
VAPEQTSPMLKPRYIAGFTGHRTGYDEQVIRPVLVQVFAGLQERAVGCGGRLELYASVAEGGDTLCVEVARELDIPVHLLLPLPEEEFAKDFSTRQAWQRSAEQLRISRQRPGRDSVQLVAGEPTRPECYFNQAMHMLEATDVVVALWDGQESRGLGGTAQVIGHAHRTGIASVQIAAASGEVTEHGDIGAGFAADPIVSELNRIAAGSKSGRSEEAGTPDELQERLDHIALDEATRLRPSLVRIVVAHGTAALLATIVTFKLAEGHPWEKWKGIFTAIELVLVSYALWMSIRLHHKHTQERWIRCRFACELVRGLRSSIPLIDPLHPLVAQHDRAWRRFALSAGLLVLEHQSTDDFLKWRDHYVDVRLSETHADGQIRHFRQMHPSAMLRWKLTSIVSTWSARLAPVFVLLSLLNKMGHKVMHWWDVDDIVFAWLAVAFLPIALPLVAGVANGLRGILDAGRRKDRYPQMVALLATARTSIQGLRTRSTVQRAVAHSEELLLDELLEWQLAMKNAGH